MAHGSDIELAGIFQASPRIMHPAMMDAFTTGDLASIIDNPADGIHVFPLFNEFISTHLNVFIKEVAPKNLFSVLSV